MSDPFSSTPSEIPKNEEDTSNTPNDQELQRDIDICRSNKSVNFSVKRPPESDADDARLLMNFINIVMNPGGLDSLMKEMGSDEKFTSLMFGKSIKPDNKTIDTSGREGCFTRKIFDILDKNRDGYVTKSELELSMAACSSPNLSKEAVDDIYAKIDPKKMGKICYEDFDKSVRELQKSP